MEQDMDKGMMQSGMYMCRCPHHKIMPLLVTLFGIVFLLGAFEVISEDTVRIVWPILVIFAGLFKLNEWRCKCDYKMK